MIEKCTSFKTSDGEIHASIEKAQNHVLERILMSKGVSDSAGITSTILENKDEIIDCLTMTASSKPKARKVNGGTKKRSPKKSATGELSEAEMAEVENLN